MKIEIQHHPHPFKITEFPIQGVHIVDNYCTEEIHIWLQRYMDMNYWTRSNAVKDPKTGIPQHQFWGCGFKRKGTGWETRWKVPECYRAFYYKMQKDFGVRINSIDYYGANGQTQGQQGTIHNDCGKDDINNISFLWYSNFYWEREWGGHLHFYNGEGEHVGQIEFVPNRLVLFDGRILHSADAPVNSGYEMRTSIVLRGKDVEIV